MWHPVCNDIDLINDREIVGYRNTEQDPNDPMNIRIPIYKEIDVEKKEDDSNE